jgi:hypothetical protein
VSLKGYDLSTSSTSLQQNQVINICVSIEGNSLMFSTSHRGKSCLNLNNKDMATILKDIKFVRATFPRCPKKSTCRLIELHYRISGELLRPGMDATNLSIYIIYLI